MVLVNVHVNLSITRATGLDTHLVIRWLVPDDGSRLILGILVYIVLAGIALYVWHKEPPVKNLSEPGEWALAIVGSVLAAGVSLGIDMLIGLIPNPKLSPIEAGTKAGSPFGFPLTVMLCPGFTMLAVAGLLRAFDTPKSKNTKKSTLNMHYSQFPMLAVSLLALLTLHYNNGMSKYELQQTIAPGDQMWVNRKGTLLPAGTAAVTYDVQDLSPQGHTLMASDLAVNTATGQAIPNCPYCCGFDSSYPTPRPD